MRREERCDEGGPITLRVMVIVYAHLAAEIESTRPPYQRVFLDGGRRQKGDKYPALGQGGVVAEGRKKSCVEITFSVRYSGREKGKKKGEVRFLNREEKSKEITGGSLKGALGNL